MRLRLAKLIIILIVLINLLLFFYSLRSSLWQNLELRLLRTFNHAENAADHSLIDDRSSGKSVKMAAHAQRQQHNVYEQLRKTITIVFRIFYSFENDIKESINSILDVVPNMPIVVYLEGIPYPPLTYELRNTSSKSLSADNDINVKFVNLKYDFSQRHNINELNPLSVIRTKYVLFMPDSVRLNNKSILQKILKETNSQEWLRRTSFDVVKFDEKFIRKILIISFSGNLKSFANCAEIHLDFPNWTIQYMAVNTSSDHCDLVKRRYNN